MQKKIYVTGMNDAAIAGQVDAAVKAVAGVTSSVSNVDKCQTCVDFDEGVAGIEDAINNAIASTGVIVLA